MKTQRPKWMTTNLSFIKSNRRFKKQSRMKMVAVMPSQQIQLRKCNPKRTKIRCRPSRLSRKSFMNRINSLRRVRSLLRILSPRLKACPSLYYTNLRRKMTRKMTALLKKAPKIHRITKMTMTTRKMKNRPTAKLSKPRLIQ